MLLQTNSYIVHKDRRAEHARLMRRFRQVLHRLGCDMFEVYEQVGANWQGGEENRRCVQIIRFRDRKHQQSVQNAERNDPSAQALIAEFCELVNFQYQQQQGYFATGFYTSALPLAPTRLRPGATPEGEEPADEAPPLADENESAVPSPAPAAPEPPPQPAHEEIVVEATVVEPSHAIEAPPREEAEEADIAPGSDEAIAETSEPAPAPGETAEPESADAEPQEHFEPPPPSHEGHDLHFGGAESETEAAALFEDELLGELSAPPPIEEPATETPEEHAPVEPANENGEPSQEEPEPQERRRSLFRRRRQV